MARRQQEPAVRPLDVIEPPRRRHRPAQVVALALFVLGAAAGYLLGLTDNTSEAAPPSSTTSTTTPPVGAGSSGLPTAEYEWVKQVPPKYDPDLWAVHTAIEHDGFLYLLIVDDIRNRISRALWRSADGANWQQVGLDLGDNTVATDLDIYKGELLVSGWLGDKPAVWRTSAVDGEGRADWSQMPLPSEAFPLGRLERVFSTVTTEINEADEIAIVAKMQFSIEPDLIPGSSATAARPQIAVAGATIWTRVADGGEEDVRTIEIPPGVVVRPTSGDVGTGVFELQAWSGWHSSDGRRFTAMDPMRDIETAPIIHGFQDGFVASARVWEQDRFELLFSDDGSAWRPASVQPPHECGDSRAAVVGIGVLLLASENFDHTCTSSDGAQWHVEPVPETAVAGGGFVWFEGNEHRFLAIAATGSEWAALVSRDGGDWERVGYTSEMSGGSAMLVGNRIVAVNRTGGRSSPHPWTVWVGEPAPLP